MNKFDRVISILIMLQSRRVVTAQALAAYFSVSLRTVYRDIRTLEAAGVPVSGEAGIGYALAEGYKLPPVMFSEQEALALVTAEMFMANITDEPAARAYASALTKIRAVLRTGERDSLERLGNSIMLRSAPNLHATEHLSALFSAVAGQRVIRMHYQKWQDTAAEWREVEPVGCYYHYNRWYLIAWCRLRHDYRTFRVNRVQEIIVCEERFENIHPTLNEYIEREAEMKQNLRAEVLVRREVTQHVENDRFVYGLVQKIPEGEWVRMTFLVPDYFVIARWVLMYTSYVRIIAPDELKTVVRRLVGELSEIYMSEAVKTS